MEGWGKAGPSGSGVSHTRPQAVALILGLHPLELLPHRLSCLVKCFWTQLTSYRKPSLSSV